MEHMTGQIIAELMGKLLAVILTVGCFSIGFSTIIKQEIQIGNGKVWKGKSTLILGIPLVLLGSLFGFSLLFSLLEQLIKS